MRLLTSLANSTRLIFFLIIFTTVAVDQLSKVLASKYLDVVCNKGFGFGIQIGYGSAFYISFIILAYLFYILFTEKRKTVSFSLALVLGGGVSNLIDRAMLGCTRDFININIVMFPSFNLADSAITFGLVLYLLQLLRRKDESP